MASQARQQDAAGTVEQLAQAARENEKLRALLERAIEMLATCEARIYCLEYAAGLRESGKFGLDGLRYQGGASRATLDSQRERILHLLRGE